MAELYLHMTPHQHVTNICIFICEYQSEYLYMPFFVNPNIFVLVFPFLIKPKNTWICICPILSTQIYSYSYLLNFFEIKTYNFVFVKIIFNEAPGIVYYSMYVHNSNTSIAFISINIYTFLLGSDNICIRVHFCKYQSK